MRNRNHQRRRAVTLVELVVSMAVMGVLAGGLASAMALAARAIPDSQSAPSITVDSYCAIETITSEMFCAVSFAERSPAAVEFDVPDRDNDSNPETIRYEWSGTPGDPLLRQYNGLTAVTLVDDIYEFSLAYNVGDSLTGVSIGLCIGPDSSNRVETSVQILNEPAVP